MKRLDKGIELLADEPGDGPTASKGATVVYNARFYLRRGEEVTMDHRSIALYRDRLPVRRIDDVEVIDHQTLLGRRDPIAGVEKSLFGMQAGGYREVMVSPHLAYGEKGIEGVIPPNALLRIQLWVRSVEPGPR